VDAVLPRQPALRRERTDKFEAARDLFTQREGDVAKGVPMSAKIGRLSVA